MQRPVNTFKTKQRRLGSRCLESVFFLPVVVLLACGSTQPNTDLEKHRETPTIKTQPSLVQLTTASKNFDGSRAWEHLRQQVSCGPRPAGSVALAVCRNYIVQQLRSLGILVEEQPFTATTPIGPIPMVNVIGKIQGSKNDRLGIASHYDTKRFNDFRFVGANDSGSSVAVLLELARVLTERQNPYTIELLFFDGEESTLPQWRDPDNTYGSRYYVQSSQKQGSLTSLRTLILLDLVGDKNLNFRREANSTHWLTEVIWSTAKQLGYQAYFLNEVMAVEDDHIPFLRYGIPAVNIVDLDYNAWHTPADTLEAVSEQSLQIVGDVVLKALSKIEQRLASGR